MLDVFRQALYAVVSVFDVQMKVKENKYTQTHVPNGWRGK
jgi:hypothetical protein